MASQPQPPLGSERRDMSSSPVPSGVSSEHTQRDSLVGSGSRPTDVEKQTRTDEPVDKDEKAWEVTLDDSDDPKKRTTARKWLIVFVLATSSTCVTCASSVVCSVPCPRSPGDS